jgi:Sigma-70, region 4
MHLNQSRLLAALAAPAECAALSVFDEELSRLPRKYRSALVLCCLQGMTNEEAARRLCRPVGSVLRRMARARHLLRGRLARRGVRTSAAAVAAFLASARASAGSVPSPLAEATVRAAVSFVAGADTLSPPRRLARFAGH